MMHHYCIYVFDSLTANEAASAIEKGQVESIIQYHSNKHHSMQRMTSGPPPPNMPHAQLYDSNLSPQKMKEREGHLNKLSQLAQLATPAPNMSMPIQPRPMQAHQLPVSNQQQHTPQQQQQQPPPQQRQLAIKQALDPISSIEAMTSSPNMDNFTIHHHPPS